VQLHVQEKDLLAQKAAIAFESQAISKDLADIDTEKASIQKLKQSNPVDPQISIRQMILNKWRSANGQRGIALGMRRSANKKNLTIVKKQQEVAASQAAALAESDNAEILDYPAEQSAIDKESKSIARDTAALQRERLEIEKLKRSNQKHRQLSARQKILKQQFAILGQRGNTLGEKRAASKAAQSKQLGEELTRLHQQAHVLMQPQNQQICNQAPAQSGNPNIRMHSQYLHSFNDVPKESNDFHNLQQNSQIQRNAPICASRALPQQLLRAEISPS
jgi:hypothetical protein